MSFWDDPVGSIEGTAEDIGDAVSKVGKEVEFFLEDPVKSYTDAYKDVFGDVGEQAASALGDVTGKNEKKALKDAAELERIAALKGEELQKHRYGQAEERLSPWMGSEKEALEAYRGELGLGPKVGTGSAYMDNPAYQSMMDESLGAVEQTAAHSGSTLYGGRRLKEAGKAGAGVQQSFYNNYMNMLGEMASPDTTTNLSSLGLGQAATMRAAGTRDAGVQGNYIVGQQQAGAAGTGRLIEIGQAFI